MKLFSIEVAEVCAFLVSDKSSYVSGSLIEITGAHNIIYILLYCISSRWYVLEFILLTAVIKHEL